MTLREVFGAQEAVVRGFGSRPNTSLTRAGSERFSHSWRAFDAIANAKRVGGCVVTFRCLSSSWNSCACCVAPSRVAGQRTREDISFMISSAGNEVPAECDFVLKLLKFSFIRCGVGALPDALVSKLTCITAAEFLLFHGDGNRAFIVSLWRRFSAELAAVWNFPMSSALFEIVLLDMFNHQWFGAAANQPAVEDTCWKSVLFPNQTFLHRIDSLLLFCRFTVRPQTTWHFSAVKIAHRLFYFKSRTIARLRWVFEWCQFSRFSMTCQFSRCADERASCARRRITGTSSPITCRPSPLA